MKEKEYLTCCICRKKLPENPIIIKGREYCNKCAMEVVKKGKEKEGDKK